MDIDNLTPFLRLQVLRKDELMFELKVTASNGRYFGMTAVYETQEPLLKFAETLIDFPLDNNDLHYETGLKNGHATFSMHFYCLDNPGHIVVEVNLEDNIMTEFRHEHKNKIKIEIIVQPNSIDNFQKELSTLATRQDGIATLYGRHSISAN